MSNDIVTDTYKSVEGFSEATFKDKGSRFIGYVYHIESESEVKDIVLKLKKEHYSARHHCYAWRTGYLGENSRCNDDGEPSGSAGKPILGQLLSLELTNILVVVVRYFGGTLLGVPGLINAYRSATVMAIEEGSVIECIVEREVTIQFDYIVMNDVMKLIKEYGFKQIDSTYDNLCSITIPVRDSILLQSLGRFRKIESLVILNSDEIDNLDLVTQ